MRQAATRRRSTSTKVRGRNPRTLGRRHAARVRGNPGVVKQPWEMTRDEYLAHDRVVGYWGPGMDELADQIRLHDHRVHVKRALAAGTPVPPEVLANYPELRAGNPGVVKRFLGGVLGKAEWVLTFDEFVSKVRAEMVRTGQLVKDKPLAPIVVDTLRVMYDEAGRAYREGGPEAVDEALRGVRRNPGDYPVYRAKVSFQYGVKGERKAAIAEGTIWEKVSGGARFVAGSDIPERYVTLGERKGHRWGSRMLKLTQEQLDQVMELVQTPNPACEPNPIDMATVLAVGVLAGAVQGVVGPYVTRHVYGVGSGEGGAVGNPSDLPGRSDLLTRQQGLFDHSGGPPWRASIIASVSVVNEYGVPTNLEVTTNRTRNKWWLERTLGRKARTREEMFEPGHSCTLTGMWTTTSKRIADEWVAGIKDLERGGGGGVAANPHPFPVVVKVLGKGYLTEIEETPDGIVDHYADHPAMALRLGYWEIRDYQDRHKGEPRAEILPVATAFEQWRALHGREDNPESRSYLLRPRAFQAVRELQAKGYTASLGTAHRGHGLHTTYSVVSDAPDDVVGRLMWRLSADYRKDRVPDTEEEFDQRFPVGNPKPAGAGMYLIQVFGKGYLAGGTMAAAGVKDRYTHDPHEAMRVNLEQADELQRQYAGTFAAVPVEEALAAGPTRVGNPKPVASMLASEINRALDKLEAEDSRLTGEMIAAGRGNERPSEYLQMNDPLSMRLRANWESKKELYRERDRRYGPGAPSRLPRGFGPLKNPATDPQSPHFKAGYRWLKAKVSSSKLSSLGGGVINNRVGADQYLKKQGLEGALDPAIRIMAVQYPHIAQKVERAEAMRREFLDGAEAAWQEKLNKDHPGDDERANPYGEPTFRKGARSWSGQMGGHYWTKPEAIEQARQFATEKGWDEVMIWTEGGGKKETFIVELAKDKRGSHAA